jgi:hypothetical protein
MGIAESFALSRRGLAWLVTAATALSAGCATTDWMTPKGLTTTPAACQVMAIWQNHVEYAADPANNGKPLPGLAGRVYVFGPKLKETVIGDGSLTAEAYDDSNQGEPALLERWEIDPATLKRLAKEDGLVGWGYTVFLPWTKRSPDLTKMSKVLLRLKYQPPKGMALFTENLITLAPGNGRVSVQEGGPPMRLPQAQVRH